MMISKPPPRPRRFRSDRHRRPRCLTFSTHAWLKFQFLCHVGPSEIGGFGLASRDDPLFVEDFLLVRQTCTPMTASFDDVSVADLFEDMADAGVPPSRFARLWLHTHPGASVEPSHTDEATFARAFGTCDWSVMAILGRTGRMSARLRFTSGPGASVALLTRVDWSDWPTIADQLASRVEAWQQEYVAKVRIPRPSENLFRMPNGVHAPDPFDFLPPGDWHAFQ